MSANYGLLTVGDDKPGEYSDHPISVRGEVNCSFKLSHFFV